MIIYNVSACCFSRAIESSSRGKCQLTGSSIVRPWMKKRAYLLYLENPTTTTTTTTTENDKYIMNNKVIIFQKRSCLTK
jgi:hypothetical protein